MPDVKIKKDGQEYGIGVIPQSMYDDVEDLKDAVFSSVSKSVTTSMTYAQAMASLYSDADFSKLNDKSTIDILGSIFHIMIINQDNQYVFTNIVGSSNALKITEIRFASGTPYLYEYNVYNHSRQDISSSNCWKNGTVKLLY